MKSVTLNTTNYLTVQAYLPANYSARLDDDGYVVVEGEDVAGWTLEDYVLPRLASGLYFPKVD